jgi:hypothetical protein
MPKKSASPHSAKEAKAPGPSADVRSNYTRPHPAQLPPTTPPCSAPSGHYWIYAFSRDIEFDELLVGKWLIRVQCGQQVDYCWQQVRRATQDGALGVASKVSTDWGNQNDPARHWKGHVICVFTCDWHDQGDVVRVGRALRKADAVRKQTLYYKPDVMTRSGLYSGNAPGEIWIYSMRPPYEELIISDENRLMAEELLAQLRQESR